MANSNSSNRGCVIFIIIALVVGGYLLYEENERSERVERANEEYRQYQMEREYGGGYQPSFTGGWTCRGKDKNNKSCDCTIKRSELDAAGLIRCSCGHIAKWHYE